MCELKEQLCACEAERDSVNADFTSLLSLLDSVWLELESSTVENSQLLTTVQESNLRVSYHFSWL